MWMSLSESATTIREIGPAAWMPTTACWSPTCEDTAKAVAAAGTLTATITPAIAMVLIRRAPIGARGGVASKVMSRWWLGGGVRAMGVAPLLAGPYPTCGLRRIRDVIDPGLAPIRVAPIRTRLSSRSRWKDGFPQAECSARIFLK